MSTPRFTTVACLALAVLLSSACSKNQDASANSAAVGPASPDGAAIYAKNCEVCHAKAGDGVAGMFPPLAGNPAVGGDPALVSHIVKYGLTGPVRVAGATYNFPMPPFASALSDAEIAAVLTYVRSSWGNDAPAIAAAQVSAVSK